MEGTWVVELVSIEGRAGGVEEEIDEIKREGECHVQSKISNKFSHSSVTSPFLLHGSSTRSVTQV